jgi:hypothetical protein
MNNYVKSVFFEKGQSTKFLFVNCKPFVLDTFLLHLFAPSHIFLNYPQHAVYEVVRLHMDCQN